MGRGRAQWVITGVADTTRQPGMNGEKVVNGVAAAVVGSKASQLMNATILSLQIAIISTTG